MPMESAVAGDSPTDRSDTLLRYSFTLLFMLAQVGVARSVFANRLWKAGRLRFEWAAALLWVPALAAYGWLLGAWCFTLVEIGDDGRGHSAWRPTELHGDLADWAGRLSYVGTFVLLVVVTVRQHLGLQRDRAEDAAFHEELHVVLAGVRTPLVGVMEQARLGAAAEERHVQGSDNQIPVVDRAERPADNDSGEQVQDDGEVQLPA